MQATRLRVVGAAQRLFTGHGYPATTIEAIAEAADVPLPTLYRLFGSKRALLTAALDTCFGGDDQPIAFADRPAIRAAQAETDPAKMVHAFPRIARELMGSKPPEPDPGKPGPLPSAPVRQLRSREIPNDPPERGALPKKRHPGANPSPQSKKASLTSQNGRLR
jgi:AcrR family transcriptional regulator